MRSWVVALSDEGARALPHLGERPPIGRRPRQTLRERGRVRGWKQKPRLPVDDELWDPADPRRDRGSSGGECLENRQRKVFVPLGWNEDGDRAALQSKDLVGRKMTAQGHARTARGSGGDLALEIALAGNLDPDARHPLGRGEERPKALLAVSRPANKKYPSRAGSPGSFGSGIG